MALAEAMRGACWSEAIFAMSPARQDDSSAYAKPWRCGVYAHMSGGAGFSQFSELSSFPLYSGQ